MWYLCENVVPCSRTGQVQWNWKRGTANLRVNQLRVNTTGSENPTQGKRGGIHSHLFSLVKCSQELLISLSFPFVHEWLKTDSDDGRKWKVLEVIWDTGLPNYLCIKKVNITYSAHYSTDKVDVVYENNQSIYWRLIAF